ncbi:PEGA domain-containing protein [Telmatocola sphagniphila]|uniref:PEGA domain-containing protein n=1 Tax=Telmatocola sphagniphila TaxID=1123043 RepID=A0A8E6B6P0_9BACT|nr:PEGA domain-containing protein [Telmatocola sphagniphila]QVL32892.1 PEGA domain-containing protein [Telmatocola sphagniphila]
MRLRAIKFGLGFTVAGLLTGCVERRFVVDSTPPGAKVYVNNQPVGFTPVDVPFTYYGKYDITLEREGYQTETQKWHIPAPWWAYPPFDFITENLYPAKIQDVHRTTFDMKPIVPPNLEEIRLDAEELRIRGQAIPDPRHVSPPKRGVDPLGVAPPPPANGLPNTSPPTSR